MSGTAKITWKTFAPTVLAIMGVLGVGLYTTRQAEDYIEHTIEREALSQADALMSEIDRSIGTHVNEWATFARSTHLQSALEASNAEFATTETVGDLVEQREREWREQSPDAPNELARELLNCRTASDLRSRIDSHARLEGYQLYREVLVTNRYGVNCAQTSLTPDYRQDDELWWQSTARRGLHVSHLTYDASAGSYSIDICVRVDDERGEFLGVLKAELNIRTVIDILDRRALERDEVALVLLDERGAVIHQGGVDEPPFERQSSWTPSELGHARGEVLTLQRLGEDDARSLSILASSRGHGLFGGLGWALLFESDLEVALTPVRSLRSAILFVAMITAVLLVLASLPITLSLRREIAEREVAESEARSASASKSRFLAMMSHEIRTPMGGVIAVADLLSETALDLEQREYTDTIRDSGDALLTIIDDILDFSRIANGALGLVEEDVDVRELVEGVLDLLALKAQESELELCAWVDPNIPRLVRGDSHRLRQVLVNLVGNSIKFTSEGDVIVKAMVRPREGRTSTLYFEVEDTGIGMSAEQAARVFELFEQAEATTSRRFGGSGLGLSICKGLVEAMGGEIAIDSEVGVGSRVHFELPLNLPASRPPQEQPSGPLVGRRALCITARKSVGRQVKLLGMAMGFETQAEVSPEVDVELLCRRIERLAPGILILDGQTLGATPARVVPLARTVPTLVLAAPSQGEAAHLRTELAGRAGVVAKPLRARRLEKALLHLLQGPTEQPTGVAPGASEEPEDASSRAHILVAEDNVVNQRVILRMLEKLGHRATLAKNGQEALQLCRENDFDLVLMDCQMPGMDGFEATGQIRSIDGERGLVRIIALTANAMSGDRERCLDAGMDDFLAKPVKKDVLAESVRRWLARSSQEFLPGASV